MGIVNNMAHSFKTGPYGSNSRQGLGGEILSPHSQIEAKKTEAFKKGKTSGNYGTHREHDALEAKYRAMAKSRALKNSKK